jgi:hypothetical protein
MSELPQGSVGAAVPSRKQGTAVSQVAVNNRSGAGRSLMFSNLLLNCPAC